MQPMRKDIKVLTERTLKVILSIFSSMTIGRIITEERILMNLKYIVSPGILFIFRIGNLEHNFRNSFISPSINTIFHYLYLYVIHDVYFYRIFVQRRCLKWELSFYKVSKIKELSYIYPLYIEPCTFHLKEGNWGKLRKIIQPFSREYFEYQWMQTT